MKKSVIDVNKKEYGFAKCEHDPEFGRQKENKKNEQFHTSWPDAMKDVDDGNYGRICN